MIKLKKVTTKFGLRTNETGKFEIYMEFDDGSREPCEAAHVGGNLVLLCESGIYICYGTLLNKIKLPDDLVQKGKTI